MEEGLVVVGIETGVDEYQNPVYVHNDYRVTFNLSDHKDRNAARDVAAEFADGYTIGGLTVFNTLYHFGTIEDNMYSSKETLYLFEEAKNIMSSHPEFEYRVVLRGGGGSEVGTGATLMVGVYKDDALLAIEDINVGMYNVLTVDKEGSATPYDKAVKLLSDYFNNKVAIEVDEETKETFDNVEYINNDLNDYFGREDGSYVGYFAVFKIAGKEHTVMIIESEELLEEDLVVSAVDSTNSIKIETNSYDVPVDVIIESRDVSKSDVVVNAGKKFNKKFSKAFDIKLLSKNSNKLLSDIAGGVNVYIQVGNEYREDDPINVFYINDNGELEETIEGKIIKDDGKLYATFMVYHFSVYALEEPLGDYIASSGEATPDTGDTIMFSVCAAIISLTGVIYIKKKYLI